MAIKKSISQFSIILIFLCVALIGLPLINLLPVKLSPSHSLPGISISFYMENSSPRVVEMEVTSKLESTLSRVKGVKNIYSRSGNGWGGISIELDKSTPIDAARFEVSTIIRQIWKELPRNVSYPQIQVSRTEEDANRPFLNYTLNSTVLPILIQDYAENVIKPKISDVNGISEIEISGATPMEWQLEYDNDVLTQTGITINDIQEGIRLYYHTEFLGMGEIPQAHNGNQFIQITLSSNNKNDLDPSKILISNKNGKLIYLSELVKAKKVQQAPKSYYRINGLNSIYISIKADESANQLQLSDKVKNIMEEVKKELPKGYELYQSYDATEHIRTELNKIYFRSGLTILILLFFIFLVSRNLKYLFLIVTSLFINLSIAIVFYYFGGIEIQLYSLAGITISLNLIIDSSIIMADHILHKKNKRIFLPILASTLTTIGALSMIFFLDEKLRLNLQDFAFVVMINLAVSLLVTLFFVPALIDKMNIQKKQRIQFNKRKIVEWSHHYEKFIVFISKYRWGVYSFFILLFGIPIFMLPNKIEGTTHWAKTYNSIFDSDAYKEKIKPITDKVLGGTLRLFVNEIYANSYFDRNKETVLSISATMPNGTTLSQMNSLIQKMESYLTTFSEIKQFQTSVNNPNRASINVFFTKQAELKGFPYQLKNKVITKALELGGGSWGVYGVNDQGFNNDVRESAGNMQVKLLGYNYDELYSVADTLKNRLLSYRRIPEVTINSDFSFFKDDYQEFYFNLDKKQSAIQNIAPQDLFNTLSTLFSKNVLAGNIIIDGKLENITLHSKQSKAYDLWQLRNVDNQFYKKIFKVNELASISKGQTPQQIVKENQQYKLVVQFNYIGSYQQGAKILKKEVDKLNETLPTGYKATLENLNWSWGKESKDQYKLLGILILIIFFITSILFNSLRQPFIVILMIPVSFIGVFLSFYFLKLNFDQGGLASLILLSGITVNSGIYILNEYNNFLKQKPLLSPSKSYIKAWNSKIIPILLTIISTILGFIPFIIGSNQEAFWFPLAVGVIGGLLLSLLGICILLPVLVLSQNITRKQNEN